MNKPIQDFKVRFNKALLSQEIKPVELSEKTGLSRSTISHYMSGYAKPKSDKLYVLAKALNVNEAWLMGYDVPMERNNYEDQNILRFEAELEYVWKVIEDAGYSLSFLAPPNDNVLTVVDKENNIVTSMHDYELVNKYESLQRKENALISAESLLFNDKETQYVINKVHAFDCQLKALGWSYKIMVEPNPDSDEHAITYALFKNENISFKVFEDDYNSFINDGEAFYKERLQQLLEKSITQMFTETEELSLNAAHERTDIDVTDEMRKHDDDIMSDENF